MLSIAASNTLWTDCATCRGSVPPHTGQKLYGPLRVICANCMIRSGRPQPDFEERVREIEARGLKLRDFQLADGRYLADGIRAHLIGSEMGTGKCLNGKALHVMNGEPIEAAAAWDRYASGPAVRDGDGWWCRPSEPLCVSSIDDATGRIVQANVTALYRQRVTETLRRIELSDGSEVTVTRVHKVRGPLAWTNDVKVGDRACVASRLPECGDGQPAEDRELRLAELLGWIVSEGYDNSAPGAMTITQGDRVVLDRLERLVRRTGVDFRVNVNEPRVHEHSSKRASYLRINSVAFEEFLRSRGFAWGTLSAQREVPTSIMRAGNDVVRAFLRAYMDGDGTVANPETHPIVSFATASKLMAKQLVLLLRRFGVWGRLHMRRCRAINAPDGGTLRDYWFFDFGGPSARRYLEHVGFGDAGKQARLKALCAKPCNTNTEGVPASRLVTEAVEASGLPASWFGLGHRHSLSAVYLQGTQEFSRESLGVVGRCMDAILAGTPDVSAAAMHRGRAAWAAFDAPKRVALRSAREAVRTLIAQEVHYPTVVAVEDVPHDGWVYDMEVEAYRNYVADIGMLCHNTPLAAMACLRSDAGNVLIVPAAVRYSWDREIQKWRPDLKPERRPLTQALREGIPPGHYWIGSFESMPGVPCPGCVFHKNSAKPDKNGKKRQRKVVCTHYDAGSAHPIDFGDDKQPYHVLRGGETCPGCWQKSPIPPITTPTVLVGDEVHAFKCPGTRRTILWRALAQRVWYSGGYVFGLSGTPWENRPIEGWEVLSSLGIERAAFDDWDQYAWIFSDWLSNAKGERKPPSGEKRELFLDRMRRVRIARLTRDVLKDLPPVQTIDVTVEISEKTKARVNEAVQRMFAVKRAWYDVEAGLLMDPFELGLSEDEKVRRKAKYEERSGRYFLEKPRDYDAELLATIEEVLTSKKKGQAFDELSKIRRLLSEAKLESVLQWVESCEDQDEPVVLFSQHVAVVKRFGGSKNEKGRPGWASYYGGLPAKLRDQIVQDYESGKVPKGIALTIGAGREGLTLVRGRVVGFVDLNWNPARNRQAIARVLRMGAEKHTSVLVTRFIADHPVDKLVLQTLIEKEALLDALNDDRESRGEEFDGDVAA